ncbi:hypothetical protein [Sphingomonas sp.]|uniref:hypothetical protein n=1 Tax=Sphingomonas sp. TaxID=28214 RepID=UPI002DD660B3|nr:hypothetical protein [Sphingomonas sp.]
MTLIGAGPVVAGVLGIGLTVAGAIGRGVAPCWGSTTSELGGAAGTDWAAAPAAPATAMHKVETPHRRRTRELKTAALP